MCTKIKKKKLLVCDIHVTYILHTFIYSLIRIELEAEKSQVCVVTTGPQKLFENLL